MCNPGMQRRNPAAQTSAPKTDTEMMQTYLKRKPLTAQEQEQRRSQSMAWEAGGGTGTNPYETLPQGRMEGFSQFKIQQNRRRMAAGGPSYARA